MCYVQVYFMLMSWNQNTDVYVWDQQINRNQHANIGTSMQA